MQKKKGTDPIIQKRYACLGCRTTSDDFAEFTLAKQIKISAVRQLAAHLRPLRDDIVDGVHLLILFRCMEYQGFSASVINEEKLFYI